MKDVMLDLETFGTGENACVVQIGACFFDRDTGEIGQTFKVNVDAGSAVKSGAQIDADTVYWWLAQDKEAIASVIAGPKEDIRDAFTKLNAFLKKADCIWSHATFDFVIIMNTLRRLNIKPSFSYRSARDIRTLVDLTGISTKKSPRAGIHHDGLDDAVYQVQYCVEAIKTLKRAI